MLSITFLLTFLTWFASFQATYSSPDRNTSGKRHVSVVSRAAQQSLARTSTGIWAPNYRNAILATSYETAQYGGRLGGACGWNTGSSDRAIPSIINGAAQKLEFFANGLACGTCVQLIPTDAAIRAKNPSPITVSIVNSCPGSCASLDVEANVVTGHFGTRLGQWNGESDPFFRC